jgi:hypothetical protein
MPYRYTLPVMLFLATVLPALLQAGAMEAPPNDPTACIVQRSTRWGVPCETCQVYRDGFRRDHSGTFVIELANTCTEMIEVKVAVQEENGVWRTYPVKALEPGSTMEAFACKGTGRYLYWVRRLDDADVTLPSDGWIMHRYHRK